MYVPYNRLAREQIAKAYNKNVMPGEKAVANYDEDSFTMALSAAQNCVGGRVKCPLDAVFFASTTAPNVEKQTASQIASALDVEGGLRAADFAGSLRAGANALLAAVDAAKNGATTLVAIADSRLGAANGKNEELFGDGAVAFEFSDKDVIAEYVDSYSVSFDFYDTWRTAEDEYPRMFEEKYAVEMGYTPFIMQAIKGLLEKAGIQPCQIAKVVMDGSSLRYSAAVLTKAGFGPEQAQKEMISEFGYSGAAYAPTLLACALQQSKPGDLILYVSYGEGSDAVLLKAHLGCEQIGAGKGLEFYRNTKSTAINYEMYLKWKKMMDFEPPRRAATPRSCLPDFYRKRKKNLALHGSRCTVCGTPHYPPSRICINCHAIDQMEPYQFQGKKAFLATFTFDYIAFSEDSPNAVAVVDFENGGRIFTQIMDYDADKLEIGMPLEMVYRKLFTADGIITYSWKCVPLRSLK